MEDQYIFRVKWTTGSPLWTGICKQLWQTIGHTCESHLKNRTWQFRNYKGTFVSFCCYWCFLLRDKPEKDIRTLDTKTPVLEPPGLGYTHPSSPTLRPSSYKSWYTYERTHVSYTELFSRVSSRDKTLHSTEQGLPRPTDRYTRTPSVSLRLPFRIFPPLRGDWAYRPIVGTQDCLLRRSKRKPHNNNLLYKIHEWYMVRE